MHVEQTLRDRWHGVSASFGNPDGHWHSLGDVACPGQHEGRWLSFHTFGQTVDSNLWRVVSCRAPEAGNPQFVGEHVLTPRAVVCEIGVGVGTKPHAHFDGCQINPWNEIELMARDIRSTVVWENLDSGDQAGVSFTDDCDPLGSALHTTGVGLLIRVKPSDVYWRSICVCCIEVFQERACPVPIHQPLGAVVVVPDPGPCESSRFLQSVCLPIHQLYLQLGGPLVKPISGYCGRQIEPCRRVPALKFHVNPSFRGRRQYMTLFSHFYLDCQSFGCIAFTNEQEGDRGARPSP